MNELVRAVGKAIGADHFPEPEPSTVRPPAPPAVTSPSKEEAPEKPPSIAQDHITFEAMFGALPLRFVRAARTLAEKHRCGGEWDDVEAAHDALRKHEPAA